jgi:hypothetical protein
VYDPDNRDFDDAGQDAARRGGEPDPDEGRDDRPSPPGHEACYDVLRDAGFSEEVIDRIRLVVDRDLTEAAALLGVHPGTMSRFAARWLPEAWLVLVAWRLLKSLAARDGVVFAACRGRALPNASTRDVRPTGPRARCPSSPLPAVVAALRPMRDVLCEDGVYLCAERQPDGILRVWPGRLPPDGTSPAIVLPEPPCGDGQSATATFTRAA